MKFPKLKALLSLCCLIFALAACQQQTTKDAETDNDHRIMTYNIRYNNSGDGINAWPNRVDRFKKQLNFYHPDIVGFQEVLHDQLIDLQAMLPASFEYVGVGRDDGKTKGEYSPLFYDGSKYEAVESGTFWLNTDPTKIEKGWDAVLPRICSWAKLKDKSSGKFLYIMNAHFDHVGVQSRMESIKLMKEKSASLGATEGELVAMMGDYNERPDGSMYKYTLQQDPVFFDSYDLAENRYGPDYTYAGFKAEDGDHLGRIDYIFLNDNSFKVKLHHTVIEDYKGNHPSDHLPVYIDIEY